MGYSAPGAVSDLPLSNGKEAVAATQASDIDRPSADPTFIRRLVRERLLARDQAPLLPEATAAAE